MKFITTPNELMDQGKWREYCELSGYSEYAVAEGMDGDMEIILTKEQVEELGL
jgi:hypothetical protein